jgi:hypothetical protein
MPPRKKPDLKPIEPENVRQPYLLDNEAPWGGFINIRLDDEQTEQFFAWYEENKPNVAPYFDEMLGAGIKASVSYDAAHQCYVMALTGALMGSTPKSRFCSTSRASTLPEVTALSVWKHVVLARGDYGNYRPKGGGFMSFG